MNQPSIDVKLLNISGVIHFATVIPPVPPRPEDETWHPTFHTQQNHRHVGARGSTGILDYILTRQDKEA